MGLDDRERRPELVRGVGGEVDLLLPSCLDRLGHPAPDRDRAEEHQPEQDRGDQELGEDDRLAGFVDRLERLADHDPVVGHGLAGEPEVDAAEGGGDGPGDVVVGSGQGGIGAVGLDAAIGLHLPQEQRRAAQSIRRRRVVDPAGRRTAVGDPDEGGGDPLVDLLGLVALDEQHHRDGDGQVGDGNERRRGERHPDRGPSDARCRPFRRHGDVHASSSR